jgi:hypothetical protein
MRKVGCYNDHMPQAKAQNPFYLLLLPVGVLFAVTACAYGVMTVRGLDPHQVAEGGLLGIMRQHGLIIMVVELSLLGALTVAAIGTDDYWVRRFAASDESVPKEGR